MQLSFNAIVFACLALAAGTTGAAAMTNEEVMKLINEQTKEIVNEQTKELHDRINELETTVKKLRNNKKGKDKQERRLRKLSGDSSSDDYKDRSICYSQDPDALSVFAECGVTDYYEPYIGTSGAGCNGGGRRVLETEELKRGLDKNKGKFKDSRKLCEDPNTFAPEGLPTANWEARANVMDIAFLEVGAVHIEEGESLMIELTATTINIIDRDMGSTTFHWEDSWVEGHAGAGIYLTAKMWPDCATFEECTDESEIDPEPAQYIPLHVNYQYDDQFLTEVPEPLQYVANQDDANFFDNEDGSEWFGSAQTNTAKLFFPDSKLEDDTTYFLTLELKVEVDACASSIGGPVWMQYAYYFAEATLGPYIMDAQIIEDADFGHCGWLNPDEDGCGLFDKLSGSADANCDE